MITINFPEVRETMKSFKIKNQKQRERLCKIVDHLYTTYNMPAEEMIKMINEIMNISLIIAGVEEE